MAFDARGRGVGECAAAGFHRVGQHEDGGFFGLRTRAGIIVVRFARLFAQIDGFLVKITDQAGAVVLPNNIRNLLPQFIALGQLNALLDVREQNKRAHGRGQFVVLVGAAELVLNKIFRIGKFAHVMVKGRHLAQQAVGPYGFGPGLHHVGHHQRVVVGAGHGDHQLLHERLFQAHELHKAEARAVAEAQLQHGAHGKEQNEGNKAVQAHGQQLHGHFGQGRLRKKGCTQPDADLANGQGHKTPDHVLTALGGGHQPGGQHAAQKLVQKIRKILLKHEHGKKGQQQPHGAVAPRRKDHGHQTHGPGHGIAQVQGIEHSHAVQA